MTTRRRAREIVLQLLYEFDLNPDQDRHSAEVFLNKRLAHSRPVLPFAKSLFAETMQKRRDLDKALGSKATNWSLRRMAAIDRNILRLGAYEILYTDTPGRVVINEAIELAKRYGDRQSSIFVNGVLDRILQDNNAAAQAPAPVAAAAE